MKYQALLAAALTGLSLFVTAQTNNISQVESILDKLEEQLLNQEGESFSIKGDRLDRSKTATPTMKFSGQSIYANPGSEKRIAELAESVGKLEQQIERLSAQVHRSKQHVIELSRQANHVSLQLTPPNDDQAAMQRISVKIDDFEVYTLEDSAGLWLPNQMAQLYSGPLAPGEHQLQISARFALRANDGIPVQTPIIRTLDKTFPIVISEKATQEDIAVAFTLPTTRDGKVNATIKRNARTL